MKADTGTLTRMTLPAALAVILALGLTACERQQEAPPKSSGQSFDSAPDKVASGDRELPPGARAGAPGQATNDVAAKDEALAAKVKAVIAAEPALKSLAFDVNAIDGVVTLHGTAGTRADSDRASRLALNVEGVRAVKNELVVIRGS